MLYYPPLSTGSIAQLPLQKTLHRRTISNLMGDWHAVKLADPGASLIRWALKYKGLSDAELSQLQDLFTSVEGKLRTFTFLDPAGNLLRWSEALSNSVWQKDGGLTLQENVSDPNGANRATRLTNTTGLPQTIQQALPIPGRYTYCFSVWARSSSNLGFRLVRQSSDGSVSDSFQTSAAWTRVESSGDIAGGALEVRCGLEVPAGGTIDVYGFQLDAQQQASDYQRTNSRGGVYEATRFEDDAFSVLSNGPDDHETTLRLVSTTGV